MSNLKAFLAQNVETVGEIEVVVSPRFKDEKGEPIKWRLRAITSEEDEAIGRACTKRVPVPGKKNMFTNEMDRPKYLAKLVAACVVEPDLMNAELQDSYKVKSEDALIKKMLLPGEYAELMGKVETINGYEQTQDDLVDEAKNS